MNSSTPTTPKVPSSSFPQNASSWLKNPPSFPPSLSPSPSPSSPSKPNSSSKVQTFKIFLFFLPLLFATFFLSFLFFQKKSPPSPFGQALEKSEKKNPFSPSPSPFFSPTPLLAKKSSAGFSLFLSPPLSPPPTLSPSLSSPSPLATIVNTSLTLFPSPSFFPSPSPFFSPYFNLTMVAEKDEFTPKEVKVYKDQIVSLTISAIDKTYDIFFEGLSLSLTIPQGQKKKLEFQAQTPGRYPYFCRQNCLEPQKERGFLVIL